MWSRFQTGSNSPFANRSARMFCTASLPRKWSIRKICDSSNAVRSVAFSARADARSVPNGFSMITRASAFRPVVRSSVTTPADADGGTDR